MNVGAAVWVWLKADHAPFLILSVILSLLARIFYESEETLLNQLNCNGYAKTFFGKTSNFIVLTNQ